MQLLVDSVFLGFFVSGITWSQARDWILLLRCIQPGLRLSRGPGLSTGLYMFPLPMPIAAHSLRPDQVAGLAGFYLLRVGDVNELQIHRDVRRSSLSSRVKDSALPA